MLTQKGLGSFIMLKWEEGNVEFAVDIIDFGTVRYVKNDFVDIA